MLVSADGTGDIAQAAFQTSLARVQTKDGRDAYANTDAVRIPVALQDVVLSVIGLQNVHRPHVMSKVLLQPQPMAVTGHFPNEFSSIYSGTGVATGAGVTVGIITQGKLTQTITDLNSFTSAHGFATVTTQTVNTGGTSNDTSGIGEWNLDSQDVVGMAGGAVGKIIFYNEPDLTNAALTANINTAVTANVAKIINMAGAPRCRRAPARARTTWQQQRRAGRARDRTAVGGDGARARSTVAAAGNLELRGRAAIACQRRQRRVADRSGAGTGTG